MGYKKFTADKIFDGYQLLNNEHVLVTTEEGVIENIITIHDAGDDVQQFEGILSPGFINAHCHIELSHLKNVIPPHTGLIDFLCSVVTKRDFAAAIIKQEIEKAEQEMFMNGIVAVGDICNTTDAIAIKTKSKIQWHSFIEVLSFTDAKANENIANYTHVLQQHLQQLAAPNKSVLTAHAPYSISTKAFKLINEATANQTISIHNQEHPAEDELYKTGGGDYLKLFKIFGIDKSPFTVTCKSSIQSYLPYFNKGQTIFLVHNTYMPEEDILFANNYANNNGIKLVYCLCPNANLYIENKRAPVHNFIKNNCHIVIGTDSYSSNWELNIIKEVKAIQEYFSDIKLETILQWATINGAKALQMDSFLGSFEKEKKPGIVLINNNLDSAKRLL